MNHLTDDQLNEMLDNRADTATLRHIDTCPNCRARLDDLRLVFTALASLPEVNPPRDLTASILAKLPPAWSGMAHRTRRVFRLTPGLKWLFAAQAIVSLAIGVWLASTLNNVSLPVFELPSIDTGLASFLFLLSSISVQLPTLQIPTFDLQPFTQFFHLPTFQTSSFSLYPFLSNLQLSTFNLTLLIVSAALLWLVGNGLLLRGSTARSRK